MHLRQRFGRSEKQEGEKITFFLPSSQRPFFFFPQKLVSQSMTKGTPFFFFSLSHGRHGSLMTGDVFTLLHMLEHFCMSMRIGRNAKGGVSA